MKVSARASLGAGNVIALLGIRVAPELRQPVGEPEGRIAKSASKGLLQLRWAWVTSKLDEEVRERRARKPWLVDVREGEARRHAQQGERDPTDFVPSRRSDGQRDCASNQGHQRKAETGDEELEREANRPARRPPARDEGHDGREANDSY